MEDHFKSIIENNKNSIYRVCRIYAIAPVTAEDLFQEVVFQIWKSMDSFKEKAAISTWIYRIALNVCMRAKHNLERKQRDTVRFDAIAFKMADSAFEGESDDRYQLLRACIETLNDAETSIIVLYLEDRRYKEIAEITGLTENHIAVKMKRIRQKLEECMIAKMNRL